mmetsp:Transcript_19477/g.58856  ORF Transcript_19477/g.58856 Transcript_19477/m.58856 type:complete len:1008 (+) Transcript_19477:234-3257(+)
MPTTDLPLGRGVVEPLASLRKARAGADRPPQVSGHLQVSGGGSSRYGEAESDSASVPVTVQLLNEDVQHPYHVVLECEARPLRARSIRLLRLTVGRMYTGRAASLESQQLSLVPPMPRVAVTSSSASSNSSPKQVPLAGPFIPLDVSTAASIEETEPEHQTSVRHTASGSATEHPSPLHRRSSFSRHRAQAAALRAARQRALLHHIQRERGTSLAWIACGGSMPFFFRRLCQNRAGTDAALDTLDDEAIRELIAKRRQVVDAEVADSRRQMLEYVAHAENNASAAAPAVRPIPTTFHETLEEYNAIVERVLTDLEEPLLHDLSADVSPLAQTLAIFTRLKDAFAMLRGFLTGMLAFSEAVLADVPARVVADLVFILHKQWEYVAALQSKTPRTLFKTLSAALQLQSDELATVHSKLVTDFDILGVRRILSVDRCWTLYTAHVDRLQEVEMQLEEQVRAETAKLELQRQGAAQDLADAALALTAADSERAMSIAQRLAPIPAAILKSELLALLTDLAPSNEHNLHHMTHEHHDETDMHGEDDSPEPFTASLMPPLQKHAMDMPVYPPPAVDSSTSGRLTYARPSPTSRSRNSSPLAEPSPAKPTTPTAHATLPTAQECCQSARASERLIVGVACNRGKISTSTPGDFASELLAASVESTPAVDASSSEAFSSPPSSQSDSLHERDVPLRLSSSPTASGHPPPVRSRGRSEEPMRTPSRRNAPPPSDFIISVDELKLRQRIGSGAAGATYLGSWRGAAVAVKVATGGRMGIQGWKAEVAALGQLRHPNVVRCWGVVVGPPMRGIVLEHCSGGDVRHALQGLTPPGFFARVAEGVATGVAYMHSMGMLHRDLKSSNCLLDAGGQVKVSDFGLATLEDEATRGNIGTFRWMAPEVARREGSSKSSDVYSFSMLMYELITHQVPFAAWSAELAAAVVAQNGARPALPAGTPAPLVDLMRRCWASDPLKRPSFRKVLQLLARVRGMLAPHEIKWLDAPTGHSPDESESSSEKL